MNNKVESLVKLISENPELPVIPMVDAEIVGDDFGVYMAEWGGAYIDEYLIPKDKYESIMFKSDEDVFDVLEKYLSPKEFDMLPEDEDECEIIYNRLPWIKAIIVCIDPILSFFDNKKGENNEV